jgi:hypothetical protein
MGVMHKNYPACRGFFSPWWRDARGMNVKKRPAFSAGRFLQILSFIFSEPG